MTILIPAYEPDQRLLTVIDGLRKTSDVSIVIVDDGSGPAYQELFRAAGYRDCIILRHSANCGKGRALKTGLEYVLSSGENEGVVTTDCDGQHTTADILKIAQAVRQSHGCIILGSRHFAGKVPLRSRFGNSVTRTVFRLVTGNPVVDTQTGLRGFPADTLKFARQIAGERFEYEMNMLLEAPKAGFPIREVEIETIYELERHTSHFRTIRDSILVYLPILKFSMASLISALIDFILLLLLQHLTGNLLLSVVSARLISATCNFFLNKNFVFGEKNRAGNRPAMGKYAALAMLVLGMNYLFLHLLNEIGGVPLAAAKIMTEAVLYGFSYWAQRKFVFAKN